MSKEILLSNSKLWDEILKANVDAMPEQPFPLFKELFGKVYPKGTSIVLLSTESSTYQEDPHAPPDSRLSDITLLVNGTDYYHLECQMHNDSGMVIRMFTYDLHLAIQHSTSEDLKNGGVVMQFPRSAVIYPEKNDSLPKSLRCRIVFQDGTEHIYQIPTVRIQSYSLQEIHEKHLNLFLPYVLLRLRPRLNPDRKYPLTKKELTDFVEEVMMILRDELSHGFLTDQEYNDYLNLFRHAANRIFKKHADFQKEVDLMTKPLIELPSVVQKRLQAEIDALAANNHALVTNNNILVANNNTLLANLNDKDAEIARLKELLAQHHIPVTV